MFYNPFSYFWGEAEESLPESEAPVYLQELRSLRLAQSAQADDWYSFHRDVWELKIPSLPRTFDPDSELYVRPPPRPRFQGLSSIVYYDPAKRASLPAPLLPCNSGDPAPHLSRLLRRAVRFPPHWLSSKQRTASLPIRRYAVLRRPGRDGGLRTRRKLPPSPPRVRAPSRRPQTLLRLLMNLTFLTERPERPSLRRELASVTAARSRKNTHSHS